MDKIKILCAEDDPFTRLEIKEKMEEKGWEVIEAGDGEEALKKYKECNPDLIILDVDMPIRTGLEVLQLIRLIDLQTPVVFYSSLANEEEIKAGYGCGANVYIVKSYSIDNLLLQVESLVLDKSAEVVTLADGVTYNFASAELTIGERCEKLNQRERKVFAVLCRNRNKLCQRDFLLEAGWDSIATNLEAQLNKQISKLKKKLQGTKNIKIVMDWGHGYCLKTK